MFVVILFHFVCINILQITLQIKKQNTWYQTTSAYTIIINEWFILIFIFYFWLKKSLTNKLVMIEWYAIITVTKSFDSSHFQSMAFRLRLPSVFQSWSNWSEPSIPALYHSLNSIKANSKIARVQSVIIYGWHSLLYLVGRAVGSSTQVLELFLPRFTHTPGSCDLSVESRVVYLPSDHPTESPYNSCEPFFYRFTKNCEIVQKLKLCDCMLDCSL